MSANVLKQKHLSKEIELALFISNIKTDVIRSNMRITSVLYSHPKRGAMRNIMKETKLVFSLIRPIPLALFTTQYE